MVAASNSYAYAVGTSCELSRMTCIMMQSMSVAQKLMPIAVQMCEDREQLSCQMHWMM